MPIATELNITQTTDAPLVAETIFGPGVTVVTSTLTGSAGQTGIYSNGLTTSPGVVPSNTGVIFSTGNVADFTNSTGTTDTNTQAGTTTVYGGAGDADLTAMSGVQTFDAVVFEAVFIPDNDFLTMQFVLSSEEYREYVNQGFNDVIAVMINGTMVELTPTGIRFRSTPSTQRPTRTSISTTLRRRTHSTPRWMASRSQWRSRPRSISVSRTRSRSVLPMVAMRSSTPTS